MTVALLLAAAAVVGGVVLIALGRADGMTEFPPDTAPLEPGEVRTRDVALLRPPMSLWGYNAAATQEALRAIAQSMRVRDVEITALRRELARAREAPSGGDGDPPGGDGVRSGGNEPGTDE